jgi:hypothetical protein
MKCGEALALIPSYLDGELQEAHAAPLRRHLLDCQGCRGGAQGDKNLKRWFQTAAVAAIPQGFAARIARRAFAGDTGEPEMERLPARFPGESAPRPAVLARSSVRGPEEPVFRFVLQATAAAALVVLALSVALRSQTLPAGSSLRAADARGEISVEQALERLDRLNVEEGRKAEAPAAATPAGSKSPREGESRRGP